MERQTSLKNCSTKASRCTHTSLKGNINYFCSLMQRDALQTFPIIPSRQKKKINKILTMYRRKFVTTKSMASVRNKWQTLMFDPTKQKVHEFFNDIQLIAKDALGAEPSKVVDHFIYAKMPPHFKRTINLAEHILRMGLMAKWSTF